MAEAINLELKKSTRHLLWLLLAVFTILIIARIISGRTESLSDVSQEAPVITQTGKIFAVSLVPSTNRFKVFTVDKPFELDNNNVAVIARLNPQRNIQEAEVAWTGHEFVLMGPVEDASTIEIQVFDRGSTESETFTFSLGGQ